MKAILLIHEHDSDNYSEIYEGEVFPVRVPNAYREEYDKEEIKYPQQTITYKHEALLDINGKPYIHSFKEYSYDPTWEEWCKVGFDHEQHGLNENPFGEINKRYIYTRKVKKFRWVININTLEELVYLIEELHAEFDYELLYNYDIKYSLTFEV